MKDNFFGPFIFLLLLTIFLGISGASMSSHIRNAAAKYEKCDSGKLTLLIKNADGSQTYYKTEATCK
jgi:outer membrane lipoprotein-sorting protein